MKSQWGIRRGLSLVLAGMAWCLPCAAQSQGDGLAELLVQARNNDPDYRAAMAARDAGLQARVAARSLFLPNVAASYEVGVSDLKREYNSGAAPLNYDSHSRTTSIRLAQPLFSMERWATWKEENARSVLAELRFIEASTELTLRLSRAVFDALLSADNLEQAKAQYAALSNQRVEAEKLKEAGVLTRTEVEDSRARELSAKASAMEAEFALQMRRRELMRIVGEFPSSVPRPISDWNLQPPAPDDLQQWLQAVENANPKIISARTTVEMMGYGAQRAQAGHYPTLDLIASTTHTQTPNIYTTLENSSGVAVRLSIPLYEGGRQGATVARAVALKVQAAEEMEAVRQDALIKASEAFWGMTNARNKIRALEQALGAAEVSLQGAKLGRQAGLKSHTEVLNALQQVYAVKRDLNKERYNHVLAGLQLKALAGQLSDEDVAAVYVDVSHKTAVQP